MKVLLVVYRDDERAGGSIRVAELLAHAMPNVGVDVHAAVAYGSGGRLARLLGAKCHLLGASGPKDWRQWIEYRRLVARLAPDIVHYVDGVGWMTLAAAGSAPKRIGHLHFRPDAGNVGSKRYRRLRWTLGTADRVIAISHGAARHLVDRSGVAKRKVDVVYNAISLAYLEHTHRNIVRERCVLGMAIRVVENKGVGDALTLLASLPARFELHIAGDGPDRQRLEARARVLGVADRVKWLGSLTDISRFYSSINFYLFMSWYEGFGLSVAEAMACGIPVVGLLGDGEIAESNCPLVTTNNSTLVPRSRPFHFGVESDPHILSRLRDAIVQLDDNAELQTRLASNARQWVTERFSADRYSKDILSVYQKTLSVASRLHSDDLG